MVKKTIYWIIGIIIGVILLNYFQNSQEGIGMKVHYYKDGKEVFPEKRIFSTITPPGGSYDAIQFEIIATNTGNSDLTNMQIINATPLAFKNALPTTIQTLSKGETKTLWISNIMNTSQFESMAQPVRFWINVSGEYNILKTYTQSYKDLNITPSCENLIVNSGIISLGGNLKYCSVFVASGATLAVNSTGYLSIEAQNITILGTLSGTSYGKGTAEGSGCSYYGFACSSQIGAGGNGGGGHASNGGSGGNAGTAANGGSGGGLYGNPTDQSFYGGSSGASYVEVGQFAYCGSGGEGGTAVKLKSPLIIIKGNVNLQGGGGENGYAYIAAGGGGGGGSGGTLLLIGKEIKLDSSTLNLNGGNGGNGDAYTGGSCAPNKCSAGGGGGGSGGRIKIFYETSYQNTGMIYNINGGSGGGGSGACGGSGSDGGVGSYYVTQSIY